MKRLALCVGLTELNANLYDGWDGACPGCDQDAARMAKKCHTEGFDGVSVLVNAMATRKTVAQVYGEMVSHLWADDLLVLFYSGHGGQMRDTDGDEDDCYDETLCLYDGEIGDDTIAEYLRWARPGVRVLYITDSCHSGSNFKGGRPRALKRDTTPGGLLHFGGCDDGRYSYGDEAGGWFTLGLLDALSDARKKLTYGEWFKRAESRVDKRWQRPVLREAGMSFISRKVYT